MIMQSYLNCHSINTVYSPLCTLQKGFLRVEKERLLVLVHHVTYRLEFLFELK